MNTINPFVVELYSRFEENELFNEYFYFLDPKQDGPYTIFGRLGDLIKDLVKAKKVKDEQLLQEFADFINHIISLYDTEMGNVIKSEIFSMLDTKEYRILKQYLSNRAYHMINTLYNN